MNFLDARWWGGRKHFFSLNKRNVSEYSIFFPALLISVFFLFFFANVQKVSKQEVGGQISSGTLQVQDRSSQSSNVPERLKVQKGQMKAFTANKCSSYIYHWGNSAKKISFYETTQQVVQGHKGNTSTTKRVIIFSGVYFVWLSTTMAGFNLKFGYSTNSDLASAFQV